MILSLEELLEFITKFKNNKFGIVYIKSEENIKNIRESINYHIRRLNTNDRRIVSSISSRFGIQALKHNLTQPDTKYTTSKLNSQLVFEVVNYLIDLEERQELKKRLGKLNTKTP